MPDVTIILGGQERHLCFDYNADSWVEKKTGLNLLDGPAGSQSAASLRAILWASLVKENPDLTIDEVGGWIGTRNAPGIYAALLSCWYGSKDDGEAPKARTSPKEKL